MTSIKEQECLNGKWSPSTAQANSSSQVSSEVESVVEAGFSQDNANAENSSSDARVFQSVHHELSIPEFSTSLLGQHYQSANDIDFESDHQSDRASTVRPQYQHGHNSNSSNASFTGRSVPDVNESRLGDRFKAHRKFQQQNATQNNFKLGLTKEPLLQTSVFSLHLTSGHRTVDGQDSVTDKQLQEHFKTGEDERKFYAQLIQDYERILIAEDVQGLVQFERETIHLRGRFVPHFDRNGDGKDQLNYLRRDIDRAVARAGDNRATRIRSAYAVYYQYASGKRRLREMIAGHYLSDLLPVARIPGARRQLSRRDGSKAALPAGRSSQVVIHRSTVGPKGVTRLGPGQIRVFTGQSKATLQSMLRDGLQVRVPKHPGRAHYGRGVYTSQQRAIAERYKTQHVEGIVAQATPKVTHLKALNLTTGAGKQAFENFINNTPGLRKAWQAHEHRYIITEAFITEYAPDVDIVIAPHGAGNQVVFRSPEALKALELSVAH